MRVLIAEDDPISQKVLQTTLQKWGYDIVVTSDGQQALEELQGDDPPKLAVLDWMMPRLDGPEVCRRVRELPGGEFFYIIMLTAKGRKEDLVAGLEAGADDYVIKPFDQREMCVRMRCGTRIVKLQHELLATRDALHVQATHDGLTGLLNRAAIFEALVREESRGGRHQQIKPLSVVMCDLDHFKSINDTYGHAVGDVVLVEASRRLTEACRGYDQIGRYGGEEFLIILPTTGCADAAGQAERLRKIIDEQPFNAGGEDLHATISMGVASTESLPDASIDELVKAADDALYRAKQNGRNRVEIAPSAEPATA